MPSDRFAKGSDEVDRGNVERDSDDDWSDVDTDTTANDGDLEGAKKPSRGERLRELGLRSTRRNKRDKTPAERHASARDDDDERETIEEMILRGADPSDIQATLEARLKDARHPAAGDGNVVSPLRPRRLPAVRAMDGTEAAALTQGGGTIPGTVGPTPMPRRRTDPPPTTTTPRTATTMKTTRSRRSSRSGPSRAASRQCRSTWQTPPRRWRRH